MSRSISLRRSPKPGALTARTWIVPRSLFTTSVASASPSTSSAMMSIGPADLDGLLEPREDVRDGRDLLVGDQDLGVLEDRLHPIGVGHEVRRDVASVELHALGVFLLEAEGLALLDGDDAVLADLVHHLGDDLADLGIGGGDRGDGGDLLAGVDRPGAGLDLLDDHLDGTLDAVLEDHRVGAGGDVAEPFGDERLAQDDRGGRAVAGDVVGLGRDLLEELRAHVLEGVLELDVASDRDPVVGDRRRAELLVEDDVPALRADRHLDRVGEAVDAALEGTPGGVLEDDLLSHGFGSLLGCLGRWRLAAVGAPGVRRPGRVRPRRSRGCPSG